MLSDTDGDVGCEGTVAGKLGLSRWAGLRRSKDTVFFRPLMSKVKNLGSRFKTRYGPSYGCCRALRIASRRTKTCVVVCSSGLTCACCCLWGGGCTGRSSRMVAANLATYDVASGMSAESTVEKNSPGSRKVVPYTNSALVQAMSSLSAERMPSRTKGRASIQCDWGLCALSAASNCRCILSTRPLAHG